MLQALLLGGLLCIAHQDQANESVAVAPEKDFAKARQPQLAVDPAGKVFVVFGMGETIYCAASDDGKSYRLPVRVGEEGVLALGMRRGPRVAATAKAVVVTAICGKVGRGKDGDVLAWRSTDGGKIWHGPVKVNTVADSAREGLHGMAAAPDGTVYCVWLDLRNLKMQVFGTRSKDGGATWQDEKLLYESPDGHVCPCCQPSVAYDLQSGLHVMWRNDLDGARDMYLVSSRDGGKTFGKPVKLGEGTWPLKRCPMDGGGLAGDGAGKVTTIWMRDKETFHCSPGQAEKSLGPGEQGWAAAAADGFYLVWITARPGAVMMLKPGANKPLKLAEQGTDPVVAAAPNGKGPVVAVWEEGKAGAMRLRAAVLNSSKK